MQSGLKNRAATLEELSASLELGSCSSGSSSYSSHKLAGFLDTRTMLDNGSTLA